MSFRTACARVMAVVAATATATLLVTTQAGDALADANGCTLSPGYTGALNCVAVWGSGLTVDKAQSRYQPGVTTWPQNLCSRVHIWQFRRFGQSTTMSKTWSTTACLPGFAPDYVDWSSPGKMANNSSFCARSSNTQTGGVLTPYACETITD